MKKHYLAIFLIYASFFISCLNQRDAFIPVPQDQRHIEFNSPIIIENIIESRDGTAAGNPQTLNLPAWLRAYINGGIDELEKMNSYIDKYVFVAHSEGINTAAMRRWAQNFSPVYDSIVLAASRIETRLTGLAHYYPDDEYGPFFESFMRKAFSSACMGAVKEDIYWLKMRGDNGISGTENYIYLILISIDKTTMQDTILNMMAETLQNVSLSSSQRNAVHRMQNNFFEGF